MIPYLPEGPPPLDEEDAGSPIDSPVAIISVLQSLGAAIPTPTSSALSNEHVPTIKTEHQPCDNNFDDFQSAPSPSTISSSDKDTASSTASQPITTDTRVNGFPSSNNETQENEELDGFGDFRSVPSEVRLRTSVVEDPEKRAKLNDSNEEEEEKEEQEEEDNEDDTFDDFQQADANDSQAAEMDELTEADRHQLENDADEKVGEEDEFNAFQGGVNDFADFQASTEDEAPGIEIEGDEEKATSKKADKSTSKKEEDFDDFQGGESDFSAFHSSTEKGKADNGDDEFDSFRVAAEKIKNDVEEDNEFCGFKEAKAEEDDFGGFQSLHENGVQQGADFGDFANFAEADNNFHAFEESSPDQTDTQSGFGDFSQSEGKAAQGKADIHIEFPTFDHKEGKESEPSSLLERILANMENVLSSCYASADDLPQANEDTLDAVENDEEAALWNLLIDFDKAFALQYQLTKSLGNECFLKALNIDSRNVLKNSRKNALPVFASQLGLLEPTRGQPESSGAVPEHSPTDGDPPIPASEFDWTSSGLTNPLDKLEEQFLCKELAIPSGAGLEVKLDPVQSILTRVRGTSSTKVETELSAEARAYLDRLANLDYMKARVLMFPVGPS